MKKHLILTSLVAIFATTGVANAAINVTPGTTDITGNVVQAVIDSANTAYSDGSYTTSISDNPLNVTTTDYSTSAGYGLYTYDHDNDPNTAAIALTTNDGSDALNNSVFTYTGKAGETNLADNPTGFTTSDFQGIAGTVDAAHGTSNLGTLEATVTTVGVENYKYLADFSNTGTETLQDFSADAPTLNDFSHEIILTIGNLVVTGDSVENKPNETQYGFEIAMDNGETGVFGIEWNESAQQYNYIYKGHKEGSDIVADDYVLTETDKDNAKAAVQTEKQHLIDDIALFNDAIIANQENFGSAKEHYDAVKLVYDADVLVQSGLDGDYGTYSSSYSTALANQTEAGTSLSTAQTAYAADLAAYNTAKSAYDNYTSSLGKTIDDKDATILTSAKAHADTGDTATLASAKTYADGGDTATLANANAYADAGDAATLANANAYADAGDAATLASANAYADAGDAATLANANAYADAGDAATLASAKTYADAGDAATLASAQTYADAGDALTLQSAKAFAAEQSALTLSQANAYTDKKVDTLEKNLSGGVAAATALSAVNVSNVSKGEVSVGAGYGYYNSQSAAAFGAAMGLSDRWSINAGAGIAQGDKTQFSIRAGTNYKFKLF